MDLPSKEFPFLNKELSLFVSSFVLFVSKIGLKTSIL
jgi:hypothetical protein